MSYILSIVRLFLFFGWGFLFLLGATVLSVFFRKKSHKMIDVLWAIGLPIIGLKIIAPKNLKLPKQAICVSNHISYLDIGVFGKILNPIFIGKSELRSWPIIGYVGAKIAGMFFIDRRRSQVVKEKERLSQFMMHVTRPMLFFPEGTTSEGGKALLSFKPALFEMVLANPKNEVVPFRIQYTYLSGKKIKTKDQRRMIAWYNDPDPTLPDPGFLAHMLQLFRYRSVTAEVKIGAPISVKKFKDRGSLAEAARKEVQKLSF